MAEAVARGIDLETLNLRPCDEARRELIGNWKRGTVSGPQCLQLYAWTAPDLSTPAPALDSDIGRAMLFDGSQCQLYAARTAANLTHAMKGIDEQAFDRLRLDTNISAHSRKRAAAWSASDDYASPAASPRRSATL